MPTNPISYPGNSVRSSFLLIAVAAILAFLSGCSVTSTPYQPKTEGFGYEETQLQENVFRISFRANQFTEETEILDYLYLRSAELTKNSGFTHFVLEQDYGKTQVDKAFGPRFSVGMGFSSARRNSTIGARINAPLWDTEERYHVTYRLGIFIIRMLTTEEAKNTKEAFEVDYLIESIKEKYLLS
ncbi:MAG: hypothetical protein MJE63_19020 [Proteobacteria bacterium]|nr:hypothetical protein [Pseudomonadota bacterium]